MKKKTNTLQLHQNRFFNRVFCSAARPGIKVYIRENDEIEIADQESWHVRPFVVFSSYNERDDRDDGGGVMQLAKWHVCVTCEWFWISVSGSKL